jgi:uncharacterized membrane-anchored protein
MTPRLKRLFIAVIVIQIVFLLGLVGYRESILISGRTAILQTVPIDPRDLFKGEYVTLRYDISTLGSLAQDPSSKRYRLLGNFDEGDTVYVPITTSGNQNPYWDNVVQTGEPYGDTDLFIKGRVTSSKDNVITVEYGIEQYFVPEGRGLEIERADDVKVRVKINRSGTAAIEALIVDGEVWRP